MSIEKEQPLTPPEEEQSAGQGEMPATSGDAGTLQAELEEANREKSQFKAIAQRAQADLLNYRRRVDEERDELSQSIASRFILKLLPLLDDLQQALSRAPVTAEEGAWLEGVRLVERKFQAFLEAEGVTPIQVEEGRPFDPWEQEALLSIETENQATGTVLSIIRRGYKHHGKVLRAAQVAVAQAKPRETQESRETPADPENRPEES